MPHLFMSMAANLSFKMATGNFFSLLVFAYVSKLYHQFMFIYYNKKNSSGPGSPLKKSILRMKPGQIIPCVEKCIHLCNTLNSSSIEPAMLDSAIIDLNVKTYNLLSEFLFNESITLSRLFKSYCMNVCGSPLWRYNNHNNIERFCFARRKAIRRLWKMPYRTHNALVHLINECNSISIILEKTMC